MAYDKKRAELLNNHTYSLDKNNIKVLFEKIKLLYEKGDYLNCCVLCSSGINLYNNKLKNNCLTHHDYKSLLLLCEIFYDCANVINNAGTIVFSKYTRKPIGIKYNNSDIKTDYPSRKELIFSLAEAKTIINIFSEQTAYNDVFNSLISTHAFRTGDGYKKYIKSI